VRNVPSPSCGFGDDAVVELHYLATARNGFRFDNRYCWVIHFNGKVINRVRAYLDSATKQTQTAPHRSKVEIRVTASGDFRFGPSRHLVRRSDMSAEYMLSVMRDLSAAHKRRSDL
jgi:hypothetical protein